MQFFLDLVLESSKFLVEFVFQFFLPQKSSFASHSKCEEQESSICDYPQPWLSSSVVLLPEEWIELSSRITRNLSFSLGTDHNLNSQQLTPPTHTKKNGAKMELGLWTFRMDCGLSFLPVLPHLSVGTVRQVQVQVFLLVLI